MTFQTVVALCGTQPTSKVWTAVKIIVRRKHGRGRRYKPSVLCYSGGTMFMSLSMHYNVKQFIKILNYLFTYYIFNQRHHYYIPVCPLTI